jgi:hypothetical protein
LLWFLLGSQDLAGKSCRTFVAKIGGRGVGLSTAGAILITSLEERSWSLAQVEKLSKSGGISGWVFNG